MFWPAAMDFDYPSTSTAVDNRRLFFLVGCLTNDHDCTGLAYKRKVKNYESRRKK